MSDTVTGKGGRSPNEVTSPRNPPLLNAAHAGERQAGDRSQKGQVSVVHCELTASTATANHRRRRRRHCQCHIVPLLWTLIEK